MNVGFWLRVDSGNQGFVDSHLNVKKVARFIWIHPTCESKGYFFVKYCTDLCLCHVKFIIIIIKVNSGKQQVWSMTPQPANKHN